MMQEKKKSVALTDEEQIRQLYQDMYAAMIAKDRGELERIHDETYLLIHMTGMRQSREEYIDSILDGTLNYYSKDDVKIDVSVSGDEAKLTGRSRVTAAVFGGGRHTWPLRMNMNLVRKGDGWKIVRSAASMY